MLLIILAGTVFLFDRLSKIAVNKKIAPGRSIEIIKNKFYLTNIKNRGAAYGLLAKKRISLLFMSFISLLSILVLFKDVFKKDTPILSKLSFSLVMGGGLGNIYDRVKNQPVTDFLYIKFKKAPVFNIADAAILFGTILSMFTEIKKKN